MNSIRTLFIGLGLFALPIVLPAQLLDQTAGEAAPDSIVQLTAEAQGLAAVAPENLPPFGTFWVVGSNGFAAPYPCLPSDDFPIYSMADGQYLIDGTDGQVSLNPRQTNATVAAALAAQAATVVALIEQAQTLKAQRRAQTLTLGGGPMPPGGGGTNGYFPNGSSYTPPDYGTNLWIAQLAITNGYLTGIASNTVADVPYGLLTNGDLAGTNWVATGRVFYGAAATNWTAFTALPVSRTNNLFLRLRSEASSDGSGLPDWWEQEYGVSDPYGDPDGDGWNNYQELQNGTNPNQFNTPPAPQGLTVNYNAINSTATLNWLPSPGPVTGYTVTDSDGHTFTVSANTTTFTGAVTSLPNLEQGGNIPVSYTVRASYAGGASAASALAPLEAVNFSGVIVPGPAGVSELLVSALPAGTAGLRLTQISYDDSYIRAAAVVTNFEVSVSSFTNHACILPNLQATTGVGQYGSEDYRWFGQAVDTNGNAGANIYLGGVFMDAANGNYQTNWLVPPFYDGRAQLKQNLIFQLRASAMDSPFQIYTNDGVSSCPVFADPADYVYAGFYDFPDYADHTGNYVSQTLNPIRPFLDNNKFRNFVFTPADANADGTLATGVGVAVNGPAFLEAPVKYQFQGDQTGLLSSSSSRWILNNNGDLIQDGLVDVDSDYVSYRNLSLPANLRNWYGLPYVSANVAFQRYDVNTGNLLGLVTNVLTPAQPLTYSTAVNVNDYYSVFGATIYPETAQPQFQTVEYDFWQPATVYSVITRPDGSSLPGDHYFSPTNASQPMILAAVGSAATIAAYAKLAVQNGYAGVYGYLGQYVDAAYQVDDNGTVTTNRTGVLSPYGSFFATEPGPAALVTMPDLDTGERGTGVVHCVALQVDKNHDGEMDATFNGPDATSSASPMVCWVNDDYDFSSGSADPFGHDVASQYNANYTDPAITCPRDLEDYLRLWLCGMPPLPAGQGYSVTMSLSAISGNPAINMVNAVEANGGTLYLTDTNVALAQVADYMGLGYGQKYQTISPTNAVTLPANLFTNGGNQYFLFEGAGIGEGQLTLTISQNGNTLVQSSTYLDIHDIKDFYERAMITNDISSTSISNWTSGVEAVQPATVSALGGDTNLVVLIHGINVANADWLIQSDTVFKRLYWAGYHGKFMAAKWPCNYLTPPQPLTLDVFNLSEAKAYKSSTALTTYLYQLRSRFPDYRLNLYVHSQGNAVASEAIKNGAPFDTYIMTQGAIPDSAYDAAAPTYVDFVAQEVGNRITPEWQPMGYRGVYTNLTGRIVNFYNPNDGVLKIWQTDQIDEKPSGYYSYDGTNCWYVDFFFIKHLVTDPQETRAMVSRARTLSVGQSGPESAHGVIQSAVDLNAQFNFNDSISEHSAQWTWPIQTSGGYYLQILDSIKP